MPTPDGGPAAPSQRPPSQPGQPPPTRKSDIPAGLVICLAAEKFPPPWFLPVEAPACRAVLEVPAKATNDATARRFVCDQPVDHAGRHLPVMGGYDDRHRQVTDNDAGECFTWAV